MKSLIRNIALKLGYTIHRTEYVQRLEQVGALPPGHFSSPISDLDEIRADEEKTFNRDEVVLGIDFRE